MPKTPPLALIVVVLASSAFALWRFSATQQEPAGPPPTKITLKTQVDTAVAKALAYLLAGQQPDGSWRADSYAPFRDGWALTPLVTKVLRYLPEAREHRDQLARGQRFLIAPVDQNGVLTLSGADLAYPVYTASMAVLCLKGSDDPATARAHKAWLNLVRSYQLGEQHGWQPTDPAYGGWSYGNVAPKAGEPSPPKANLSATLFALAALQQSGVALADPAIKAGKRFVESCQNVGLGTSDMSLDGGFFASPTEAVLNKAGMPDMHAPLAPFASYGSATADGIRALLLSSASRDSPRIIAAKRWFTRHFEADHHGGLFHPSRMALRDGYYYYYAWSTAHAMVRLGITAKEINWHTPLAKVLVAKQRPDGSWSNTVTDGREDEPLLATCYALAALANCRLAGLQD